jgi:hydrogenase nickel incorporation protein HypB
MCTDCGCNEIGSISIDNVPDTLHTHIHLDSSGHIYKHSHPNEPHNHTHTIPVHQGILAKNDRIAEQNRQFLRDRGVLALNLLSSPGAGKTALIERMAQDLPQFVGSDHQPLEMAVIVGDLATDNDAQRLRRAGAPAVQITTGNACHLEAAMVAQAMTQVTWSGLDLLVIENVGNLVCPASYDLGETIRVVVLSVTEGEDKPLKYPTMFKTADVVLISKVDVTTAVGCDLGLAIENIQRIAPQAQLFQVSARTGAGLEDWYQYLITAMSENIMSKTTQPEIALP